MDLILNSNYEDLKKWKDSCISLDYRKLCQKFLDNKMKIFLKPNEQTRTIRLLVNKSTDDLNDEKIIKYINDMLSYNPDIQFCINVEDQKCFEKAKKIMEEIKTNNKVVKLYPDIILRDRTSIDLRNLNCITIVPLQYVMWHNGIEEANSKYIRFDRRDNSDYDGSYVFEEQMNEKFIGNYYKLEDVLKLKKVILEILNSDLKLKALHSDLQKVLLTSQYMSNHIIYPDYKKMGTKGIKIIDRSIDHNAYYTLTKNEGVCEGQAEAFMLLLNNPIMNIDCRTLVGLANVRELDSGHAWNILKLRESEYYYLFDQTWQNGNNNYEYTFTPLLTSKGRLTEHGIGGSYKISQTKLPKDFLKSQLNEANEREKKGVGIYVDKNLDDMINNYRKSK